MPSHPVPLSAPLSVARTSYLFQREIKSLKSELNNLLLLQMKGKHVDGEKVAELKADIASREAIVTDITVGMCGKLRMEIPGVKKHSIAWKT